MRAGNLLGTHDPAHLTMERLHGVKIGDRRALDEAGVDRKKLAKLGACIVLKMVLEDGFFHADPHPGNFLVKADPVIGLLDYGIVGQLDEATRDELLFLFLAILDHDMVNRLIMAILATGFIVGLGVLMLVYRPSGWEAFIGWLFGFGFLVAVIIGTWVMLSVVRGKHH